MRSLPGLLFTVIGFIGPAAFEPAARAAEILLTWQDNSWNESGFRVERAVAGLAWQEVAVVGADVARHVDAAVQPGVLYSYRVRAFNAAGNSGYSNVASTTIVLPVPVDAPPTISALADRTLLAGTSTAPLLFTIDDGETAAEELTVTVRSSNPALVPENGIQLAGAGAERTLVVTPGPNQSGVTTITVTVSDGLNVSEASFLLRVELAATPPVFAQQPADVAVDAGGAFVLVAAASGEGPVLYQWYRDGVALAGASAASYAVPSAQRFHAGTYHVVAMSGGRAATSDPVTVDVLAVATGSGRLVNLSTRARCGTGDAVLIPGLVVGGTAPRRVLLRAVGPTLGDPPFAVPGVLANPRLRLQQWDGVTYATIADNLDWAGASDVRAATAIAAAFDLPTGSRDAALVVDLAPGQYSLVADDEAGGTGIGLVEIYDADPDAGGARLSNLSNRGLVGAADDVMIAGFVVAADGPATVLVRAVGPGLSSAPFNVPGVLVDPVLEIHGSGPDGVAEAILVNDDWGANADHAYTAATAAQVAAFPLEAGSRDAAFVATLPPGAYTALVRGSGGGAGIALIEIYLVH